MPRYYSHPVNMAELVTNGRFFFERNKVSQKYGEKKTNLIIKKIAQNFNFHESPLLVFRLFIEPRKKI